MENNMAVPAVTLLGTYYQKSKVGTWRDICTPMFIAALFTIAKRWKQPLNRWMNKQNVEYTCNGILFSFKKKGNSDTYYNMDKPEDIMLSEINQS